MELKSDIVHFGFRASCSHRMAKPTSDGWCYFIRRSVAVVRAVIISIFHRTKLSKETFLRDAIQYQKAHFSTLAVRIGLLVERPVIPKKPVRSKKQQESVLESQGFQENINQDSSTGSNTPQKKCFTNTSTQTTIASYNLSYVSHYSPATNLADGDDPPHDNNKTPLDTSRNLLPFLSDIKNKVINLKHVDIQKDQNDQKDNTWSAISNRIPVEKKDDDRSMEDSSDDW